MQRGSQPVSVLVRSEASEVLPARLEGKTAVQGDGTARHGLRGEGCGPCTCRGGDGVGNGWSLAATSESEPSGLVSSSCRQGRGVIGRDTKKARSIEVKSRSRSKATRALVAPAPVTVCSAAGSILVVTHRPGAIRMLHMEHRLAAFAQLRPLPHHAGGDAVHVGNFRAAQPHCVARTSLRLLRRVGMRRRRQHCKHQRRCEQQRAVTSALTSCCESHVISPLVLKRRAPLAKQHRIFRITQRDFQSFAATLKMSLIHGSVDDERRS